MMKWLERAQREFLKKPDQGAAKRDDRILTAAPRPAICKKIEGGPEAHPEPGGRVEDLETFTLGGQAFRSASFRYGRWTMKAAALAA
jgi:hypothetical protein